MKVRNTVAKFGAVNRASTHKDRKKASKAGDRKVKHKKSWA